MGRPALWRPFASARLGTLRRQFSSGRCAAVLLECGGSGGMDMGSVDFAGIVVAVFVVAACALVMWLGRP